MKIIPISILFLLMGSSRVSECQEQYTECSSIGCVHASATLLSRINTKINPCDDFYSFACDKFIQTTYTPDEKVYVNTESQLTDRLDENLLRILSKPIDMSEPRSHQLAKHLYKNCMDMDAIKSTSYKKIHKLLDSIGGWPILSSNWHEQNWTFENFILSLRKFSNIGYRRNIFRNEIPDGLNSEMSIHDDDDQRITGKFMSSEETALEHEYPIFMYQMATSLGAQNSSSLRNELNEALELGKALNQLLNGRNFNNRSRIRMPEQIELNLELDFLRWLEIFDRFKLKSIGSLIVDYTKSVYDNLKDLKTRFSKRTFANYFVWRIVDFTSQFLDNDALESTLKLFKATYGVIDREQRWKFCVRLTRKYAELASGSLYINDYFPKESRDVAVTMAENIIDEFRQTITMSEWMDEMTKAGALQTVNNLKIFIGYDERVLEVDNVEEYYDEIDGDFTDEFLYLAMQLNILQADKSFQHKYRNVSDWTIYARPTTTKASYNRNDNSIYFAAAFLQPPNFDKNRPMAMNFGAIGSIIAHELTHCFDRFTEKINEWSSSSIEKYVSRLKCIVQQYNSFIDPDLNVNLNGTATITEDTADNGGIKLAYRAYDKWIKTLKYPQSQLIALNYTPQQLFWISYAQFYCSVQRDEWKRLQLELREVHSFDRFRVIGPLSNAFEFSKDFNCSINSRMNVDNAKRCSIW